MSENMKNINTTFIGGFSVILLSLLSTTVLADPPGKEYWESHKEQMKDQKEHLKQQQEMERESQKNFQEMQREDRKHYEEMERERLKHEKEMYQ